MKIVFEITDGQTFRCTKEVAMMAVPQLGTMCDPDGTNFREVKQVYHRPGEIVVWLETDQCDSQQSFKKHGWKREAL